MTVMVRFTCNVKRALGSSSKFQPVPPHEYLRMACFEDGMVWWHRGNLMLHGSDSMYDVMRFGPNLLVFIHSELPSIKAAKHIHVSLFVRFTEIYWVAPQKEIFIRWPSTQVDIQSSLQLGSLQFSNDRDTFTPMCYYLMSVACSQLWQQPNIRYMVYISVFSPRGFPGFWAVF